MKLSRSGESQVLVQQVMAYWRIGPALKSLLAGSLPRRQLIFGQQAALGAQDFVVQLIAFEVADHSAIEVELM